MLHGAWNDERILCVINHDGCAFQQGSSETLWEPNFTSVVLSFFFKSERIGLCDLQVLKNLWLFSRHLGPLVVHLSYAITTKVGLQMFSYLTLETTLWSRNSQLHFTDGETKLKEWGLVRDFTYSADCKWQSQDLHSDQFDSKTSHCLILSCMHSPTERINSINLYNLHRVNIGNYVNGVYHSLLVTVPVKTCAHGKQQTRQLMAQIHISLFPLISKEMGCLGQVYWLWSHQKPQCLCLSALPSPRMLFPSLSLTHGARRQMEIQPSHLGCRREEGGKQKNSAGGSLSWLSSTSATLQNVNTALLLTSHWPRFNDRATHRGESVKLANAILILVA